MSESRLKSFNYAIGMFGTSIPINMLKTYAAIYYVDTLGSDHGAVRLNPVHLHLHRCAGQPDLRVSVRPHPHPLGHGADPGW